MLTAMVLVPGKLRWLLVMAARKVFLPLPQKILLCHFLSESVKWNAMTKSTMNLPKPVEAYLRAINTADLAAFQSCFAPEAVVKDIGREIHGIDAISNWASHEIIAVKVSLEILKATARDGQCVVTFKIDGTFNRTGLPDPFVMDHCFTLAGDNISALTCMIAEA